jgi:hypothetical protein
MVVGFIFTSTRFILRGVLAIVLRDDRGALMHQYVSWVVDLRDFEFYLRDFAAHSDGVSPADAGVIFYTVFVTLDYR